MNVLQSIATLNLFFKSLTELQMWAETMETCTVLCYFWNIFIVIYTASELSRGLSGPVTGATNINYSFQTGKEIKDAVRGTVFKLRHPVLHAFIDI